MTTHEIASLAKAVSVLRQGIWTVAVHDRPDAIQDEWAALESSGHTTAFQRLDWLQPWYAEASAAGLAEPVIAVVYGPKDKAPVLIMPLCAIREQGRRVIEFAGLGLSDYRAPVLAGADRLSDADAVTAARAATAAVAGDLIRFSGIVPAVGGRANPLAAIAEVESPMGAHVIPLLGRAEPSKSQASFTRDLDRLFRKLTREKGEPRLIVADTPFEAARLFDAMMDLRAVRFDSLGRDDALSEPAWQRFYKTVFAGQPAAGFGYMVGLEVGGQIIAADACIRSGDAFLILAGSFRQDEEWRKYGLGNMLTYMEMTWAAGQGLAVLDLTIGDEAYKSRFGAERVPLRELHAARSLRALPSWATWRAKSTIRQSPPLMSAARAVQAWLGRAVAGLVCIALPVLYFAAEALAG